VIDVLMPKLSLGKHSDGVAAPRGLATTASLFIRGMLQRRVGGEE
jgi:hypothetical protein